MRKIAEVPIAPVETIRHRLQMNLTEFSQALGYGDAAYGDMNRKGKVSKTVALAAECLSRRQAPGAQDELCWITRIVKGAPMTTMLDELQEMTLAGQRYLLVPADQPRQRANWQEKSASSSAGNGVAAQHPGTHLAV